MYLNSQASKWTHPWSAPTPTRQPKNYGRLTSFSLLAAKRFFSNFSNSTGSFSAGSVLLSGKYEYAAHRSSCIRLRCSSSPHLTKTSWAEISIQVLFLFYVNLKLDELRSF
ncbi:unnamed protein product [Nesidiocoris tenuis]|uniref:Uncharacterized protein n=1 Tax=Nesidiocoris tenuis TaxID=355587 RepID=A0A6H5H3Y7_9HEMI|nr:unnamed protein product [Nesidiocoris tenuis]